MREHLGDGTFGRVLLAKAFDSVVSGVAEDRQTGGRVAVKVIKSVRGGEGVGLASEAKHLRKMGKEEVQVGQGA